MASSSLETSGSISTASAVRDGITTHAPPAGVRRTPPRSSARALGSSRDLAYVTQFLRTSIPLWLADMAALVCSLAGAAALADLAFPSTTSWLVWLVALAASGTLAGWFGGLYPAVGLSADAELRHTTIVGFLLFGGATIALLTALGFDPYGLMLLGGAFLGYAFLCPFLRRQVRWAAGRTDWWAQPVLIFGGGESALRTYRKLATSPECGLRPIGIVDSLQSHWKEDAADSNCYLGPRSGTAEIIERDEVFRAIVPLERGTEKKLGGRLGYISSLVPHVIVTFDGWTPLSSHTSGESPVVGIPAMRIDQRLLVPGYRWAKFALDFLLVLAVSPIVFPIIAVVAASIYLTAGSPVFFRQMRVGVGGKMFPMLKFRTMVVNAEQVLQQHLQRDPELKREWDQFHKLTRDPRVTRIGRFLRRTSLDELPQIWNVVCGQMSFIGPRPYYEVAEVHDSAPVVMRVRPGITGWWQISGRNKTTFDARLVMDNQYVRDWSPWLDLYILFRTVKVVATGDGAA